MSRDYFVCVSGNDRADGRSVSTAWRTVQRVNEHQFEDGDSLFFEAGQIFEGTLRISGLVAERSGFVLSSFGDGVAVLDGADGSGIFLTYCRGVNVSNLCVQGKGRKSGNNHGIGVQIHHCVHVTVDNVETYGFQFAGIAIEGSEHVAITRVHAHDNGFAGITTHGALNQDIYVGHSRAINNPGDPTITDNHSGNGICLYSVSGALVEYCEAAENGWDMQQENWNGPVGIWTAAGADRVIIQFCIAHHNKSPKGDGGGFDFDGGTTNCLMQYNYSYQNGGCGYLLCQYQGGALWKNNTIRYCISENDGLTDHRAGFFTYMGEILYDCWVYNNVVYTEDGRNCVHGAPVGSHWYNNVFLQGGDGEFLHEVSDGVFENNCYWHHDGHLGVDGYPTIEAWKAETGFETRNGMLVGVQVDPQISLPPAAGNRVTDPSQLQSMPWYRLLEDSPLARAGLNLSAIFGVDTGKQDFFGRPLSPDGTRSIGVSEIEV